jgi:beta-lactam-binding protein with PASTA domain
MDLKKFWKESSIAFVLKNIALAVIVFAVLVCLTLVFIDRYTHHGEAEVVPNIKGLYAEEAEVLLKNHGLLLQVVDSVYDLKKPLGTIVEQTPSEESIIKRNRPVYVVINSREIRLIPLPDINDVSHREAMAMLRSLGFKVNKVEYSPSEYKDLVISIKHNGRVISSGTRLVEGSSVSLVVGSGGGGNEQTATPSLIGLKLNDGRAASIRSSLIIGAINYDVEPADDEDEYVIYRQQPAAGKTVTIGSRINLWLSKDRTKQDHNSDSSGEEEFF